MIIVEVFLQSIDVEVALRVNWHMWHTSESERFGLNKSRYISNVSI